MNRAEREREREGLDCSDAPVICCLSYFRLSKAEEEIECHDIVVFTGAERIDDLLASVSTIAYNVL